MFVRADYVQAFSHDGVVRKLEVFRCTMINKDFVLLEDLRDHFDLTATRFEREDGISLTLMRDNHLQRYVPERLPACQGLTIYIVSSNSAPTSTKKSWVPSPSPPPPSTSSTSNYRPDVQRTVSETAVGTMVSSTSSTSSQPRSPPNSWNNRSIAARVFPLIESLPADTHHPHTETPSTVERNQPSDQTSRLRHSIVINFPESGTHNAQEPIPRVQARTVQDANNMLLNDGADSARNRSTAGGWKSKEELEDGLASQAHEFATGVRHENEAAVVGVLERCKGTLVRFAQILAKAEEILGTSFDFEHGNGPRFFIILPDSHVPWEATNVLENYHFRLFFLCECGSHTRTATTSITPSSEDGETIPCLHLTSHEGYVLRQPDKFVEKYGPYLLVMLEMLKFGHQISGYSLPGLCTRESSFPANAMPPSSLTLDRVNKSIAFLEAVAGLDALQPWKLTEYLGNLKATDGIDIDNLMSSYLVINGNRNLFSNMYRMKTALGRADWVCRLHHPTKFEHSEDRELESVLSSVDARLDRHLRKITVTLTSSWHADGLCNVMAGFIGLGSHSLELIMNYSYSPADLEKLEQQLSELSDIGSVTVSEPPLAASLPPAPETAIGSYPTPEPSDRRRSVDSQSDLSSNYGRCSSRTGSVSSDLQSPAGVNTTLPDWIYVSHPAKEGEQGYDDGRRRHSVATSPYMLPNDFTEAERLDGQHYLVRYCFQGNFNVKLDRNADLKILDVGTGTGVWALEMAHEFPKAEVYGVDMSFIATPEERNKEVPPNCHFKLCNILEGLPFPDNHFDFVYQRLLVYALTPAQRKQVNAELFRVLKPLGHAQLVESDGLIYNAGPKASIVNNLSLESAMKRLVDPKDVQHLKPGLKRVGFSNINSFNIALPVGDWGGQLGRLSRTNMHGLATIWLKGELGRQTDEECEATLAEIDKECEQRQSFYKVWLVVGQKPLLECTSPPPTSNRARSASR